MVQLPFDPNAPGSFLGKGLAWPLRENPDTGDFLRAEGLDSIEQSLEHLVQIAFMEIPGFERMGTTVDELLFNNNPEEAKNLTTLSIKRVIDNHERRVQLLNVAFVLEQLPSNTNRFLVKVALKYRVKATGELAERVFPFNLTVPGDVL